MFFNDVSSSILLAILDIERLNVISRLLLSAFRYLETAREWVKARIMAHYRIIGKNGPSRLDLLKSDNKNQALPRIPPR